MIDKVQRRGHRHAATMLLPALLGLGAQASAQQYGPVEQVTAPTPFFGVHGLAIDQQGRLLAGSVNGSSMYVVDRDTGKVSTLIGALEGQADGIAIGPDNRMAWTSFTQGVLRQRQGDGPVQALAKDLPGINSVAYNKEGRLFAAQVFLGDALWEFDPAGQKPPRKILENIGGLNSFEFGADGWLYGPLVHKGQVARVNVDTGQLQVIAGGFMAPLAARFDARGDLHVVDSTAGEVVRIDPTTGARKQALKLSTGLDNLVIDRERGLMYVSNMDDNAIHEIDLNSGAARTLVSSPLAAPAGLAMHDGTLYVADVFAFRTVDPAGGKVTDVKRMWGSDLEYPMSASANDRNVILSSWFTNSVQVVDRKTFRTKEMLHGFKAPMNAVQLRDGSLLVAELGSGSLLRVSGEGGKDRAAVVQGLQGPSDVVLSADGRTVYVVESFAGRVLAVNTADWSKRDVATGLQLPESAALTPDGQLVVLEQGAKRIMRIDPATGASTPVAANIPVGATPIPGFPPTYLVNGLTVAANGDVFFSSDTTGAIYRVPRTR